MPANPHLLQHLLTRRSVGGAFLAEPGPTPNELEQLLTAATRVPDHGKLNPWRLIVFKGDARSKAGEKLAAIAARLHPEYDTAALDNERNRFLPAPLTIGVVSTAQPHPKIPEFEQLLSAGNVAFNLVHAAHALGFAANWTTRWYAFDAEAGAALGLKPGERFVGFVAIGTAKAVIEERPRPALADIVTEWQG